MYEFPLVDRLCDDFEQHRARLVAEGLSGHHAVMTTDGLLGVFPTLDLAYHAARRARPLGEFAIKEVQAEERVEFISAWIRN